MKHLGSRLPSPAMIVALIALVVALGGTTYAAIKLPKNSVGGKQLKKNSVSVKKIKKNAVTGAKVKDQSLTGKDIDLGRLGTVPSAQQANSLSPMEATHFVGRPGEPGFENGSKPFTFAAPFQIQPVGFYKDHDGIVHLQGVVVVGIGTPVDTIFTLPPGFRPANSTAAFFTVLCLGGSLGGECEKDDPSGDEESYSVISITGSNTSLIGGLPASGTVVGEGGAAISLDGVSFRAES
jgi:hypothetical protein